MMFIKVIDKNKKEVLINFDNVVRIEFVGHQSVITHLDGQQFYLNETQDQIENYLGLKSKVRATSKQLSWTVRILNCNSSPAYKSPFNKTGEVAKEEM